MVNLASIKIGGVRYNSPTFQIVLLGFVVFCTVGMFSAINNLGAGGTQDIVLSDTANGVLYGLFALAGIVAGSACNLMGPRLTLLIGSLGYALYIGGLWCHQTTGNSWFLILSAAILGVCAALLWSAQGSLMMSLPLPKDKGRAFSIFWSMFQSGTLLGAIIVLAKTINNGTIAALGTGIYLAFIIVMFIGTAASFLILPTHLVVREDGSLVKLQSQASVKEELTGMWKVLKDWRLIALLPMFFASNYFYAWQGAVNAFYFDGRTRALVALLEAIGSILGSILVGLILDLAPFKTRRSRGYFGIACVTILIIVVWGCGLAFQLTFTRASVSPVADFTDGPGAVKPIVMLMFMYVGDAAYQGLAYWIMGTMSNDPWALARIAGIYKAVQSAGGAGSYGMDAVATPYLNELLASALMVIVSLPLAAWVIAYVEEHVEDQVFVEEVDLSGKIAIPAGHHAHDEGAVVNEKDENVV